MLIFYIKHVSCKRNAEGSMGTGTQLEETLFSCRFATLIFGSNWEHGDNMIHIHTYIYIYIHTRVGWTSMKTNSIFTIDASIFPWFLQHLKDLPANILKRREFVKLDPPNTSKNRIRTNWKNTSRWCMMMFFCSFKGTTGGSKGK